MIVSRTPHRVSFFGGGTDYPSYYLEHGGKVLGAAIDKYCYLNVRRLPPFFWHKHRIVYAKQETVNEIDEIQHPAVREVLRYLNVDYGVSIHHDGDIPARSGMGSSSAFTVGLLKSMTALDGCVVSDEDLMLKAIHVEQNLIGENVGSQDQAFAAFGGLNLMEFMPNGRISVRPVVMAPDRFRELEDSLLLYFTGVSRIASEVAAEQIKNTERNLSGLEEMKRLVDEGYGIITDASRDLRDFGLLLNETWKLKKSLSSRITTDAVESIYEDGRSAGAVGGKLLGAGGGGFFLFFVEEEHRAEFRGRMSKYLEVPFRFDLDGSKIVVYQPERAYE